MRLRKKSLFIKNLLLFICLVGFSGILTYTLMPVIWTPLTIWLSVCALCVGALLICALYTAKSAYKSNKENTVLDTLHSLLTLESDDEALEFLTKHLPKANITVDLLEEKGSVHAAAAYGRVKALAHLLDLYPVLGERSDGNFRTPLLNACRNNQTATAQLLLERNANVSATEMNVGPAFPNDYTALHYAALRGNVTLVRLLLKYNANCNIPDSTTTPLHLALEQASDQNLNQLVPSKYNGSPNFLPRECAKILIEHDASLETTDWIHQTPLRLAITGNLEDIVRLMLDKRPDLVNGIGATRCHYTPPIAYAAFCNRNTIFQLLIDRGADVNFRKGRSKSPLAFCLDVTSEEYNKGIILLLKAGAIVELSVFHKLLARTNHPFLANLAFSKIVQSFTTITSAQKARILARLLRFLSVTVKRDKFHFTLLDYIALTDLDVLHLTRVKIDPTTSIPTLISHPGLTTTQNTFLHLLENENDDTISEFFALHGHLFDTWQYFARIILTDHQIASHIVQTPALFKFFTRRPDTFILLLARLNYDDFREFLGKFLTLIKTQTPSNDASAETSKNEPHNPPWLKTYIPEDKTEFDKYVILFKLIEEHLMDEHQDWGKVLACQLGNTELIDRYTDLPTLDTIKKIDQLQALFYNLYNNDETYGTGKQFKRFQDIRTCFLLLSDILSYAKLYPVQTDKPNNSNYIAHAKETAERLLPHVASPAMACPNACISFALGHNPCHLMALKFPEQLSGPLYANGIDLASADSLEAGLQQADVLGLNTWFYLEMLELTELRDYFHETIATKRATENEQDCSEKIQPTLPELDHENVTPLAASKISKAEISAMTPDRLKNIFYVQYINLSAKEQSLICENHPILQEIIYRKELEINKFKEPDEAIETQHASQEALVETVLAPHESILNTLAAQAKLPTQWVSQVFPASAPLLNKLNRKLL